MWEWNWWKWWKEIDNGRSQNSKRKCENEIGENDEERSTMTKTKTVKIKSECENEIG